MKIKFFKTRTQKNAEPITSLNRTVGNKKAACAAKKVKKVGDSRLELVTSTFQVVVVYRHTFCLLDFFNKRDDFIRAFATSERPVFTQ